MAGETWTDRTAEFSAGTSGSPASVTLAGGALHVCDGTYDVSVAVTASAVVLGHGTTEAPVLRGSQTASVLSVTTGGVDLDVRSLTLVPGGTDRATSTRNGGGVRCEPSTGESSVSLHDVTVRDGKLSSGGGVYASHCDVAITESAFRGLEVTFGGAVYATGAASAFSVSIADSVIEDNTAQQYGAGVYAYGFHASTVSLEDTIVEGNAAWRGGGLWLGGTVTATCSASAAGSGAIRDNSAGHYGGGVVVQDAAFSSALCDFGESTTDNAPTDVHVTGASPLTYADYGPNATFSCTSTGCASI